MQRRQNKIRGVRPLNTKEVGVSNYLRSDGLSISTARRLARSSLTLEQWMNMAPAQQALQILSRR